MALYSRTSMVMATSTSIIMLVYLPEAAAADCSRFVRMSCGWAYYPAPSTRAVPSS
jgi:hypothetical protein